MNSMLLEIRKKRSEYPSQLQLSDEKSRVFLFYEIRQTSRTNLEKQQKKLCLNFIAINIVTSPSFCVPTEKTGR